MKSFEIPKNVKEIELELEKPNYKTQIVFEEYLNGFVCKEDLINRLSVIVVYHPLYFGIKISKEEIGEFYLFIKPVIERIISQYEEKKSRFSTYFYINMKYSYQTWNRKKYYEKLHQKTINYYAINEKILSNNFLTCSDFPESYNENKPIFDEIDPKQQLFINGKVVSKLSLLVLALKFSFYLTESQISKISSYLEIPDKKMEQYIKQCLDSLQPRLIVLKKLETSLNRYSIKKNQIMFAMNSNTSNYSKNTLQQQYDFCSTNWKKYINRYKNKNMFVSQNVIGEILNIPTGRIRYMLKKLTLTFEDLKDGYYELKLDKDIKDKGIV